MDEQQNTRGLNGWIRLWIALAIIGLVPAIYTVATEWENANDWISEMSLVPPNKVNVDGVGVVEFPATMSPEAIVLVTRDNAGKPDGIRAAITSWTNEFNDVIRSYVSDLNRSLVMRVAGYWVGTLVLLYFIGLLLAWVRRGFRTA
jgi:hypothetical protein